MSMYQQYSTRGRPREFEIEPALDKAIDLFRTKGFIATSISDLSKAMDLTVGSIYKAFGDKSNLFSHVFNRYLIKRQDELNIYLTHANTGYDKIQTLLSFYIDSIKDLEGKKGCLVVGSTIELDLLNHELTQAVESALKKNLSCIKKMIEEGKVDKSIHSQVDVDQAASILLCLVLGIRVVGKSSSIDIDKSLISSMMKILT